MNIQSQNLRWNRDVLLSANAQLDLAYQQEADPCIALMILRNYHLLLAQSLSSDDGQEWRQKAKVWLQRYIGSRANSKLTVFYDESELYYDSI